MTTAPFGAASNVVALSQPGFVERFLAFAALFMLTVGLPTEWFVQYSASAPIDTGGDVLPTVVFAMIGLILISRLMNNGSVVAVVAGAEPMLVVIVALALVSVVWSPEPIQSFRRVGAFGVTTLVGYYLVTRYSLSTINKMMALVLIIATVLNYTWIFLLPEFGVDEFGVNWTGITSNRNVLGRLNALGALVFVVAMRDDRKWRIIHATALALQLPLVLGAGSRTSLASYLLILILLAIYQFFRAKKTLYGAVAVSLTGSLVLGIAVATANFGFIVRTLDRDVTLSGRTQLWADLFDEAIKKPIAGHGWEAYWGGWFSPSHEIWIKHDWLPPTAHNAILEMFLALGLLGTIPFVIAVVRGLQRSAMHVRYVPGALGLWPLGYLSLVAILSVTESGIAGRTVFWVLLIVALVHASRLRRVSSADQLRQSVLEASHARPISRTNVGV